MRVGLLVAVSALCILATALATPIDNYLAPPTTVVPSASGNITKYVHHAHRASLNFACTIQRITVTSNNNPPNDLQDPLTQVELEDHLGEPDNIEWAHVMQQYFESTDPRGQERQLGTLGGDLGEFLIVLAAIEAELGRNISSVEVEHKFKAYLTVMSREKFYFDIDIPAINSLKKACGCPNLNIADPPDSKKEILHNSTHTPQSNSNELFRKVLENPSKFEIRAELVHSVLDAFYSVMWKKSDPLHRRIKLMLLRGPLEPKGFVIVKTPGYCNAQLLAPLISPELCSKQMSVYHGDAAVLLRTEIAGVLMYATPEDKNAVVRKANTIASLALSNVMADHKEPTFTVAFEGF